MQRPSDSSALRVSLVSFLMVTSSVFAGCISGTQDSSNSMVDGVGDGNQTANNTIADNNTGNITDDTNGTTSVVIAVCPANADGHPVCECLDGYAGSLTVDPVTGMWAGSCSLVQCPDGALGLPCDCDADHDGEFSWNNTTQTWDGVCSEIIDEPIPEAWGNGSVRFIYVINDIDPDDIAPFHLRFVAEPMSDQNPVMMALICSMSEGHQSNVWQAWVSGPFNTITSWHAENANDLSLGKFKSSSGLKAENIVGYTHPTATFTREVGAQGHVDAVILSLIHI